MLISRTNKADVFVILWKYLNNLVHALLYTSIPCLGVELQRCASYFYIIEGLVCFDIYPEFLCQLDKYNNWHEIKYEIGFKIDDQQGYRGI